MNAAEPINQLQPPQDPRSRKDFLDKHFPLANGNAAPPVNATERNDRITIGFLSIYYELNCLHARLLEIRGRPASPDRDAAERDCLLELEKLLIVRDEFEDFYAPCGIVTRPVVKDGFTVNIRFSFGNANSRGKPRGDFYQLTAEIPIPLPPGARLEDYIVDFEGPEPFMPLPD